MKNSSIKIIAIAFLLLIVSAVKLSAQIMVYHQGFDSISILLTHGWEVKNNSNPLGPGTSGGAGEWTQGVDTTLGDTAFSGPLNSFAMVDYSSTDPEGVISDWLLSDTMMLRNGDTVSLYTVSFSSNLYPDNLEVRFSAMGTSNNVGTDTISVGDFSNLLFAVNPNYDTVSYPSLSTYDTLVSDTWTKFYGIVSGLTGYTSCRLALRYFVHDGGVNGSQSSTIGVDSLTVTRGLNTGIKENNMNLGFRLFPNPTTDKINLLFSSKGNYLVNIYNTIGQDVLSFTTENSKTIDVSSFAPSLYYISIADIKTGYSKSIPFMKQ